MYNILPPVNLILLTADMILLCTKEPVPNSWFSYVQKYLYPIHGSHSPFDRKMCILLLVWCHGPPIWPPALPLNLTYIWTVPLKLFLWSPPYKLLIIHVPYLVSIFRHLGRCTATVKFFVAKVWDKVSVHFHVTKVRGKVLIHFHTVDIKSIQNWRFGPPRRILCEQCPWCQRKWASP
jgi:hypothetical protein